MGKEAKILHLAGRKMFLGNSGDERGATSVIETEKFDTGARDAESQRIYQSSTAAEFCARTTAQGIDFVEFNTERTLLPAFPAVYSFPRFEVESVMAERILYVNARAGCAASG
jgi:hypothetical protein